MGYRQLSLIALIITLSFCLTGCNGARETDEIGYVVGIGLDKATEDGMLNITYQFAVPRALGSSEGGGKGDETVSTITLTAPSLAEARNLITTTMARSPNLSHNKVFIIGEDLARQGVAEILAPVQRFREFRGSMYVMIVNNGTAQGFMEDLKPSIELLPSKYIETSMLTNEESGYYPQSFLHDFYTRIKEGSGAPYAALISLNSMRGKDKPEGSRAPGEKAKEYTAGNIPMFSKGTPTNVAGTAIFKQDKMVGTLTTEETRMFSILRGKLSHGFLVLSDPIVPKKNVHVSLRLGRSPKIQTSLLDGHATIKVDVILEGEISAIASGINYEKDEYRRQLEDHVSTIVQQEIIKMLSKTQRLGSDVVGFGYHFRPLFTTYQEWLEISWDDMYSQADIFVEVSTRFRRGGLMRLTAPLPEEERR